VASEVQKVPLIYVRPDAEEALAASEAFLGIMSTRRDVAQFSGEPVPYPLVVNAIATALPGLSDASAVSFVIIADPVVRHQAAQVVGNPGIGAAPYLVVICAAEDESTAAGVAAGLLLASVHMAGLVASTIAVAEDAADALAGTAEDQPARLILGIGYPAADAEVPDRPRKPLAEVITVISPDA